MARPWAVVGAANASYTAASGEDTMTKQEQDQQVRDPTSAELNVAL